MSAPGKPAALGTVLDFSSLLARARRASRGPDEGFERRQAALAREQHLRRSDPRIPDRDWQMLCAGEARPTPHLKAVQKWVRTLYDKPVLCLGGTKGSGKTVAASWGLAEVGGAYVHAHELARLWSAYGARERAKVAYLLDAHLVVLDDLGTEPDSAAMEPVLLDLVDGRQGKRRRTIITTNVSAQGLQQRYPDPRMWSRLLRDWIYFGASGADLREETTT